MIAQPDDATCGPTSLHAVYRYFGQELDLASVIDAVAYLEGGGTLAAYLGLDVLASRVRGLHLLLRPSPVRPYLGGTGYALSHRQATTAAFLQKEGSSSGRPRKPTSAFCNTGASCGLPTSRSTCSAPISTGKLPVLAGLSATYLYRTMREYAIAPNQTAYHDLQGEPAGHFVVLYGFSGWRHSRRRPLPGQPL